MDEDKWITLSRIESKIYEDTISLLKPIVDKVLEEKIPKDCGSLHVSMKGKGIYTTIDLLKGNLSANPYVSKCIEFDNEYVWQYVINFKYYHNDKVFGFKSYDEYETITFDKELYDKLDSLNNNEEYIKLMAKYNILL